MMNTPEMEQNRVANKSNLTAKTASLITPHHSSQLDSHVSESHHQYLLRQYESIESGHRLLATLSVSSATPSPAKMHDFIREQHSTSPYQPQQPHNFQQHLHNYQTAQLN